ncbi:hypothetical protein L6R29_05725 [Myxococcota bacterium]|nr:hypothetical protein [Myxococcota bacterium]
MNHPSHSPEAAQTSAQHFALEGAWDTEAPQRWEQQLSHTAHQLCQIAQTGGDGLDILKCAFPQMSEHLCALKKFPAPLALWGKSRNWDEHTKQQIVEPAILDAIGRMAGTEMCGTVLHAGLLHTYGYLFSLVETPFGYKRDRWLHEEMGARFGLPDDTFSPLPQEGSLLLNLTYFLGSIVFSPQAAQRRILRRLRKHLSPALTRCPFAALQRWRITEALSFIPPRGSRPRQIRIYTDLVYPVTSSENVQLLIYSIEAQADCPALVTTFFTSSDYVETLLRQPQGQYAEISLRYNASFGGLENTPQLGVRAIMPMV